MVTLSEVSFRFVRSDVVGRSPLVLARRRLVMSRLALGVRAARQKAEIAGLFGRTTTPNRVT